MNNQEKSNMYQGEDWLESVDDVVLCGSKKVMTYLEIDERLKKYRKSSKDSKENL